jgi:hypothetical protein
VPVIAKSVPFPVEFSAKHLFNCAKLSSLHIVAMKDESAGWAA